MKHLLAAIMLTSSFFTGRAQTLAPTVISSTGGFSSNANGSLSYTVGEMTMVQTFSASNYILTQGFQQPLDNVTGLIDITHDEFGSLVAYPNPAVNYIWYGFQFPVQGKVSVQLSNVIGQTVKSIDEREYKNGKVIEPVSVSEFAAGLYFITATFVSINDNQTHIITKKFEVIR